MSDFKFRVDGGEEQTLTVKTAIYDHAVAAIPALFDLRPPLTIEIWYPPDRE